jgi:hypothetical protein
LDLPGAQTAYPLNHVAGHNASESGWREQRRGTGIQDEARDGPTGEAIGSGGGGGWEEARHNLGIGASAGSSGDRGEEAGIFRVRVGRISRAREGIVCAWARERAAGSLGDGDSRRLAKELF